MQALIAEFSEESNEIIRSIGLKLRRVAVKNQNYLLYTLILHGKLQKDIKFKNLK